MQPEGGGRGGGVWRRCGGGWEGRVREGKTWAVLIVKKGRRSTVKMRNGRLERFSQTQMLPPPAKFKI